MVKQVKVGNTLSRSIPITSGTIQGSNLGPMLYSIFVNDMMKELSLPYSLYADNLKLYGDTSTTDGCVKIQESLDAITSWASRNGMKINVQKSLLILLGKGQNYLPFTLADEILPWQETAKDLGVNITKNLKFNHQVGIKTKKCFQIIGQIKRTIRTRKEETLKTLWNTLILPTLLYASSVWYQETAGINLELQRVCSRFWKMLPSAAEKVLTPVEEVLKNNLLMMKRIMSSSTSIKAENFFEFSKREARQDGMYIQNQKIKTLPGRENFFNRIINDWNKIPTKIKEGSYERFSEFTKEYVKNKYRSASLQNTNAAIRGRMPVFSV